MKNSTNFHNWSSDEDDRDGQLIRVASIVKIILLTVLVCLGTLGNLLIICVYWKKKRKSSTHVFIGGLASADLIICLLLICHIAEAGIILSQKQLPENWYICEILTSICNGTSVGITAFIAVDRYDCVCRPQKRWFNKRRAKISILMVVLLSVVTELSYRVCIGSCETSSSPLWVIQDTALWLAVLIMSFCYTKVYMTIQRHVKINSACVKSQHGHKNSSLKAGNKIYSQKPHSLGEIQDTTRVHTETLLCTEMASQTIKLKPQVVKTISTCALFIESDQANVATTTSDSGTALKAQNSSTCAPPSCSTLQRKTTRMLFMTSVVFVLTWLPSTVCTILDEVGTIQEGTAVYYVVNNLVWKTFLLNSTINPLIYGLANRRFRDDCRTELQKIRFPYRKSS